MQLQNLKNSRNPKKIIVIFLIIVIAILISIFSTAFGLSASCTDKIIVGISINNIDVSNLTKSEAMQKLNEQLENNLNREITLSHGEYNTQLNLISLDATYDLENSVDYAYNIGRSDNNIFTNKYTNNNFNITK